MMLFLKLAYGDREKGNLFKECLRSKSQVFQHQHLRKQVSLSTKISKSGLFPHISVGKTEPVVIHYLIVQDSSRTLQNHLATFLPMKMGGWVLKMMEKGKEKFIDEISGAGVAIE